MDFSRPSFHHPLGSKRLDFLKVFKKSCIRSILSMLYTSQSGHPGGSLSSLDFLTTLYAFRLTHSYEKIIISNGHISPAVYALLAECGVIDREDLIRNYRQFGSHFEGHVARQIPGVYFGTGPLGVGASAAAGMALAEKKQDTNKQIFLTLGDGECQEGQIHEMMLFAAKYKLNNLTAFVDYNRVQLTQSIAETMPIRIGELFRAGGWDVLDIDGHSPEKIWSALSYADKSDKPTIIIGHTIMGYGVDFMEPEGRAFRSTWHGKAPSREVLDQELKKYECTIEEQSLLESFRTERQYAPKNISVQDDIIHLNINTGTPVEYCEETLACRKAYGQAVLDIARKNPFFIIGTADLGGSVKTQAVEKELPNQYIEYGICEQNMISVSGGLSLSGLIPFCSTFGAFMSSRAKDQVRVNDINRTNVKMVATHCGLSVGRDGPTHQAIDDMGSFAGLFHTYICEPADANHCDRIIRYIAGHHGNFYVRMGRHALPILKKSDGSLFFDKDYQFYHGRTDIYKPGNDVTIVVSGSVTQYAIAAAEQSDLSVEVVITSSPKVFDETLIKSLTKTKRCITVEDHTPASGMGAGIAQLILEKNIPISFFHSLGVRSYQLSGSPEELYAHAKTDTKAIIETLEKIKEIQ